MLEARAKRKKSTRELDDMYSNGTLVVCRGIMHHASGIAQQGKRGYDAQRSILVDR